MMRFPTAILASIFLLAGSLPVMADDWPQWMGPTRDGVWPETGILKQFPEGGPKVLWRQPVGAGYAGPAVVGERVFVTDYQMTEGDVSNNPGAKVDLDGRERVLALDATTGKEIWKFAYDCPYKVSYPGGPRCTPTYHDDKLYTLGAMGNLYCLNAANGEVVWKKNFVTDYKARVPQWGFCGHPLVYENLLICLVGGEGSIAVAFDKETGKEVWRALSAKDQGYCPPTLIKAGGVDQVLIWHAESINSLNPKTGEVYWTAPLAPSYDMSINAPMKEGSYLFASGIGRKALCLKLGEDRPTAEELWRGDGRNAVYCANSTPLIEDNHIYGCDCETGQLRCVKLENGEIVWESYEPVAGKRSPHGTAFLVKNADRYFIFSETGELIIAKLSPKGYEEVSRAKILEPTNECFGRPVVWVHPAFARRCCFVRNDKEIVCVSLAE